MAINIKDVSFNYGSPQIIKGINLYLKPGQLVSLVGPNGAGKTTLLKLICGTLKPTTGEIYIQDRPGETFTKKERASRVSLVPQNPKLPEEMKVSDFVMLGAILTWDYLNGNRQKIFKLPAKQFS